MFSRASYPIKERKKVVIPEKIKPSKSWYRDYQSSGDTTAFCDSLDYPPNYNRAQIVRFNNAYCKSKKRLLENISLQLLQWAVVKRSITIVNHRYPVVPAVKKKKIIKKKPTSTHHEKVIETFINDYIQIAYDDVFQYKCQIACYDIFSYFLVINLRDDICIDIFIDSIQLSAWQHVLCDSLDMFSSIFVSELSDIINDMIEDETGRSLTSNMLLNIVNLKILEACDENIIDSCMTDKSQYLINNLSAGDQVRNVATYDCSCSLLECLLSLEYLLIIEEILAQSAPKCFLKLPVCHYFCTDERSNLSSSMSEISDNGDILNEQMCVYYLIILDNIARACVAQFFDENPGFGDISNYVLIVYMEIILRSIIQEQLSSMTALKTDRICNTENILPQLRRKYNRQMFQENDFSENLIQDNTSSSLRSPSYKNGSTCDDWISEDEVDKFIANLESDCVDTLIFTIINDRIYNLALVTSEDIQIREIYLKTEVISIISIFIKAFVTNCTENNKAILDSNNFPIDINQILFPFVENFFEMQKTVEETILETFESFNNHFIKHFVNLEIESFRSKFQQELHQNITMDFLTDHIHQCAASICPSVMNHFNDFNENLTNIIPDDSLQSLVQELIQRERVITKSKHLHKDAKIQENVQFSVFESLLDEVMLNYLHIETKIIDMRHVMPDIYAEISGLTVSLETMSLLSSNKILISCIDSFIDSCDKHYHVGLSSIILIKDSLFEPIITSAPKLFIEEIKSRSSRMRLACNKESKKIILQFVDDHLVKETFFIDEASLFPYEDAASIIKHLATQIISLIKLENGFSSDLVEFATVKASEMFYNTIIEDMTSHLQMNLTELVINETIKNYFSKYRMEFNKMTKSLKKNMLSMIDSQISLVVAEVLAGIDVLHSTIDNLIYFLLNPIANQLKSESSDLLHSLHADLISIDKITEKCVFIEIGLLDTLKTFDCDILESLFMCVRDFTDCQKILIDASRVEMELMMKSETDLVINMTFNSCRNLSVTIRLYVNKESKELFRQFFESFIKQSMYDIKYPSSKTRLVHNKAAKEILSGHLDEQLLPFIQSLKFRIMTIRLVRNKEMKDVIQDSVNSVLTIEAKNCFTPQMIKNHDESVLEENDEEIDDNFSLNQSNNNACDALEESLNKVSSRPFFGSYKKSKRIMRLTQSKKRFNSARTKAEYFVKNSNSSNIMALLSEEDICPACYGLLKEIDTMTNNVSEAVIKKAVKQNKRLRNPFLKPFILAKNKFKNVCGHNPRTQSLSMSCTEEEEKDKKEIIAEQKASNEPPEIIVDPGVENSRHSKGGAQLTDGDKVSSLQWKPESESSYEESETDKDKTMIGEEKEVDDVSEQSRKGQKSMDIEKSLHRVPDVLDNEQPNAPKEEKVEESEGLINQVANVFGGWFAPSPNNEQTKTPETGVPLAERCEVVAENKSSPQAIPQDEGLLNQITNVFGGWFGAPEAKEEIKENQLADTKPEDKLEGKQGFDPKGENADDKDFVEKEDFDKEGSEFNEQKSYEEGAKSTESVKDEFALKKENEDVSKNDGFANQIANVFGGWFGGSEAKEEIKENQLADIKPEDKLEGNQGSEQKEVNADNKDLTSNIQENLVLDNSPQKKDTEDVPKNDGFANQIANVFGGWFGTSPAVEEAKPVDSEQGDKEIASKQNKAIINSQSTGAKNEKNQSEDQNNKEFDLKSVNEASNSSEENTDQDEQLSLNDKEESPFKEDLDGKKGENPDSCAISKDLRYSELEEADEEGLINQISKEFGGLFGSEPSKGTEERNTKVDNDENSSSQEKNVSLNKFKEGDKSQELNETESNAPNLSSKKAAKDTASVNFDFSDSYSATKETESKNKNKLLIKETPTPSPVGISSNDEALIATSPNDYVEPLLASMFKQDDLANSQISSQINSRKENGPTNSQISKATPKISEFGMNDISITTSVPIKSKNSNISKMSKSSNPQKRRTTYNSQSGSMKFKKIQTNSQSDTLSSVRGCKSEQIDLNLKVSRTDEEKNTLTAFTNKNRAVKIQLIYSRGELTCTAIRCFWSDDGVITDKCILTVPILENHNCQSIKDMIITFPTISDELRFIQGINNSHVSNCNLMDLSFCMTIFLGLFDDVIYSNVKKCYMNAVIHPASERNDEFDDSDTWMVMPYYRTLLSNMSNQFGTKLTLNWFLDGRLMDNLCIPSLNLWFRNPRQQIIDMFINFKSDSRVLSQRVHNKNTNQVNSVNRDYCESVYKFVRYVSNFESNFLQSYLEEANNSLEKTFSLQSEIFSEIGTDLKSQINCDKFDRIIFDLNGLASFATFTRCKPNIQIHDFIFHVVTSQLEMDTVSPLKVFKKICFNDHFDRLRQYRPFSTSQIYHTNQKAFRNEFVTLHYNQDDPNIGIHCCNHIATKIKLKWSLGNQNFRSKLEYEALFNCEMKLVSHLVIDMTNKNKNQLKKCQSTTLSDLNDFDGNNFVCNLADLLVFDYICPNVLIQHLKSTIHLTFVKHENPIKKIKLLSPLLRLNTGEIVDLISIEITDFNSVVLKDLNRAKGDFNLEKKISIDDLNYHGLIDDNLIDNTVSSITDFACASGQSIHNLKYLRQREVTKLRCSWTYKEEAFTSVSINCPALIDIAGHQVTYLNFIFSKSPINLIGRPTKNMQSKLRISSLKLTSLKRFIEKSSVECSWNINGECAERVTVSLPPLVLLFSNSFLQKMIVSFSSYLK